MKRLGERIKKRREHLRVQLNDLADQVGVSTSALSQIENAKAFPSIITLKKIADCLHTTVGEIIGEHETLSKNPLLKGDEKKFVKENDNGARLYLLSHHDLLKQMEPYLIVFPEKSNTSDIMNIHHGQEFCHVLKGSLEVDLDGKKYVLKQGDNFYFNSTIPHTIKNVDRAQSEMLWIVTPPNI